MTGTLSPEDYAQQQQIIRQQRMADMLMSQNQQPQGQMVSGRYVAPNIFQQLQPVANMLVGAYMGKQGDTQAQKLYEAQQERANVTNQGLVEALRGTKAQAGNLPLQGTNQAIGSIEEPMGNYVAPSASTPPDQAKILALALQGKTPFSQTVATHAFQQMNKPPEEFNLGAEETRYRAGPNGTVQQIATGKGKEVVAATDNLGAAERLGFPRNPTLWTPQQRQAIQQEVIAEHNRKSQKNTYTIDARVMSSMSAPIGEMLKESKSATAGAYNTIQSADKILGSVDKAITGPMANQRVGLAQISNTLGLGTEKNPEALAASRQVIQNMAIMQLGTHVKGEGAVSDFERRLKAAASGGEISFTPVEIKQMAKTAKQTAGYTIQQHNTLLKNTAALGPTEQKLSTLYQINPPQNPNDVFNAADAIINNGKK